MILLVELFRFVFQSYDGHVFLVSHFVVVVVVVVIAQHLNFEQNFALQ